MSFRKGITRVACLILVLSLSLFCLFSCSEDKPKQRIKVYEKLFDTDCVLHDYSESTDGEFAELSSLVGDLLLRYHRLFDTHKEYEGVVNLATVNKTAGKGAVQVDAKILDLLSFSIDMHKKTDGKVSIAIGAVSFFWKELLSEGDRIPTDEELDRLGEHVSIDDVIIDRENSTVEILDPELRIDVGAIAKGYAAGLVKKELVDRGVSGVVLDLGGNLCAVGCSPDGEGWQSYIRNPLYKESSEPYIRTVTVSDNSLVTSGVYERYYTVDGVKYHHIIDPVTLRPENRYLSVTVMSDDSGTADALSTAFFNMSEEEIRLTFGKVNVTEVTLVLPSGEVVIIN